MNGVKILKKLISILLMFCLISNICAFAEDIPIESIKVSAANLKMEVGTSQKIKVITYPSNSVNGDFEYYSSDSAIVTAAVGTIIANKVGTAAITVKLKDSEISDTVTIDVISSGGIIPTPSHTPIPTPKPEPTYSPNIENNDEISVRSVEIYDQDTLVKKSVEIMATQTKQFTVKIYPLNATDLSVRWRSYNTDIATVDSNGIVKGVNVGETKIYAVANDNGKSYTINIKIIPYVRYPDSISIMAENTPTFKTGESFKMKVNFLPDDTTEREINWFSYSDCAIVDQNGNVTVFDKGKTTIRAYTNDYKQTAVFEFDSTYSDEHFTQIKEDFGVKSNKNIIIDFDADVSSYSASQNIFAGTDANGEKVPVDIEVNGKRAIITPINGWSEGENYIFIKSNLIDIYGNKINKNLKYKFNVRMVK